MRVSFFLHILFFLILNIFCFYYIFSEDNLDEIKEQNESNILLNIKLIMATDAQNLQEVQRLIEIGADVNAKIEGLRPLHIAITYANKAITEKLLKAGADPNKTVKLNNKKYNALELAYWYIRTCSFTLRQTEFLKSQNDKNTKNYLLIDKLCQDCQLKLHDYELLIDLLESFVSKST
jgi:hypothetical protein